MNSKFTLIIRILLSLVLLLSGFNKLFEFFPTPLGSLNTSFGEIGYLINIVAVFEILIGALLLSNRWVAFALVLLVPLSLNILLFHIYLNFQGILPAIIVAFLNGILLYKQRRQYVPLFN